MQNSKRFGKTGLILLGIVWLGLSFSGCGPSNTLLLIVLILSMVNTLLLIVGLGVLIVFIIKKL